MNAASASASTKAKIITLGTIEPREVALRIAEIGGHFRKNRESGDRALKRFGVA